MVYVWIGFYMIYRLLVIYSYKVLISDCYFRTLSLLPVSNAFLQLFGVHEPYILLMLLDLNNL